MFARTWALGFICSIVGITAGATTACSSKPLSSAEDSKETHSNTPTSDAGTPVASDPQDDEEIADAGGPPARPSDEPTCSPTAVDDPDDNFTDTNCDGIDGNVSKAIFVTSTGNDNADGSMAAPVATFSRALQLATASNKDVYACRGEYSEATVLITTGVRVYGGYDCTAGWKRDSNSQARLVSTSNVALIVMDADAPVVLERIDIAAANATAAGDSSIAAFLSNSQNVSLRRGSYAAGSAADASQPVAPPVANNGIPACAAYVYPDGCYGEPGTNAYQYSACFYNNQAASAYYMTAANLGSSAVALAPSSEYTQHNTCRGGLESYGGKGGGTDKNNLQLGTNGTPGLPASTTGNLDGADGAIGQSGSGSTAPFGLFDVFGYLPNNRGNPGQDGQMGQSGTGGNGGGMGIIYSAGAGDFPYYLYAPRAGGGKGGFGGCPGQGGAGGEAGGASFAIASYRSHLALERVTLTTSKGGNGSAGALGGDGAGGQPGGGCGVAHYECSKCPAEEATACATIAMTNTTSAQPGGKGGKGGKGGQGGPGGGGPSIPLVVAGEAPTLTAVTFLPGSGGLGGNNGSVRGADGESKDQKVMP